MAVLFQFLIIFYTMLFYTGSYCEPFGITDLRVAVPSLNGFCAHFGRQARIRKIFCVICKGFDESCFKTTTSTTTPTTTTTTGHTTSSHTTTSHSTTKETTTTETTSTTRAASNTTAVTPSTRNDQEVDDEDNVPE